LRFFLFLFAVATLLVLGIIVALVVSHRKHEEYAGEVAEFVRKIVTVLKNHERNRPPGSDPYLSVQYIHDLLIAPQDRKRKGQTIFSTAIATPRRIF